MHRRKTCLAWMLGIALVAAAPAAAQDQAPTDQYGGPGPGQPPDRPPDRPPGQPPGQPPDRPPGQGVRPATAEGDRETNRNRGPDRGNVRAGRTGGDVSSRESGAQAPLRAAQGGSLPFTGLDLTVLLFVGGALVMVGAMARVAERRLARRRN